MNAQIKQCWDAAAQDTQDNSWESQEQFMERFAQQIVGETVAAILCTDTRNLVYTTHDKAVVDSVIGKVIDQVRDHWSFQ